jgi:cellulose synthase (UDP-forming)
MGKNSIGSIETDAEQIVATVHGSPRRQSPPVGNISGRRVLHQVVFLLASIAAFRYLAWRVCCTLNPAALWFFYLFLVAEILGLLETLFFYFTAWHPQHHRPRPPLKNRTVDIFITTFNEPVDMIRETAVCALNVRYPHKTYILDDGARAEVKVMAAEIGALYIGRTSNEHAKAGNLNHALTKTDGEFIVLLDTDHVPTPNLIEDTLGLFADPKVGIVQTPQDFYNLDSFQHRTDWKQEYSWQQQELFFSVIQPGKDHWNSALFCGSPALARRASLEKVGGFATGTVTEDFHTALRLQAVGDRVVYHNVTVARGLAPQTFNFFAGQWLRWGQGAMQILRQENPLGNPRLTLAQKLSFFSSIYFYWMSYQKVIYLFTPMFALLTGIFPLRAELADFWLYFGPYFILNTLASVLVFRGFRSLLLSEQFSLIKLHVMLKTLLGLRKQDRAFKVTPKTKGAVAEWREVWPQISILVFSAAAIAAGFYRLQTLDAFRLWTTILSLFWAFYFMALTWPIVRRALKKREDRVAYRFDGGLDVPVVYQLSGSVESERVQNYARNMNRTGLSLTTTQPITNGSLIEMEIHLPGRTIAATGEVMRTFEITLGKQEKRYSNGIRFKKIAPAAQDAISLFLFYEIAPRKGRMLHLTASTQSDEYTITRA